jgi:ribosomal RNA-processing protein 1
MTAQLEDVLVFLYRFGHIIGFWMSDKWVIQQHLAEKLAQVATELSEKAGMKYIHGFWDIIIREWHGIDRLR